MNTDLWNSMAPGPLRQAFLGGSALERLTAGLGLFTIYAPLRAAAEAERSSNQSAMEQMLAGVQAQGDLDAAQRTATGQMQSGYDAAAAEYQRQQLEAQRYQQSLGGYFAQDQAVGDAALAQLNQTLIGGDSSGLALDPYYEAQRMEGERALERQAAAQGNYGGGVHFRELSRFNQQLASQEYDAAIGRLMGLAQTGQAATANYANLNQNATNNMLGVYGAQAGLQGAQGQNLAGMTNNLATAQANVLNRASTGAIGYQLQGANAAAWGTAQANNAAQNGLNTLGYSLERNQRPQVQPQTMSTPYYDAGAGYSSDVLSRTA